LSSAGHRWPGKIVHETLSRKKKTKPIRKRLVERLKVYVGPEFKPQYHQKKKEFKGNSTQGHQEDPSSPSETMTILKVIRLK
jgi:hypothetical protein